MKRQNGKGMTEDPSEYKDNSQDENQGLTAKDTEFDLDHNVDLMLPFLHGMVSDEPLISNCNSFASPMVTTHTGMGNHEATEEKWEKM